MQLRMDRSIYEFIYFINYKSLHWIIDRYYMFYRSDQCLVGVYMYGMICWLDLLFYWLSYWLIARLLDWLIDWLIGLCLGWTQMTGYSVARRRGSTRTRGSATRETIYQVPWVLIFLSPIELSFSLSLIAYYFHWIGPYITVLRIRKVFDLIRQF